MPTHEVTMAQLREARLSTKKKKWKTLRKPTDQYGRGYIVWTDTENGDATSAIERQFTAPVDLPDRFMRIDPDRPWRMNLDFVPYIKECRVALAEWEHLAKTLMQKLYGEKAGTELTPEVLRLAGHRPQDWRVVELARRGDPWCLGITKTRTAPVKHFIGDNDFIPRQLGAGLDGFNGDDFDLGDEFERQFGKLLGKNKPVGFQEDRDKDEERQYRARAAAEIAAMEAELDAASEIMDGSRADVQIGDDVFAEDDRLADQVSAGYGDEVLEAAADLEDILDGGATGGTKVPVRRQRIPRNAE